MKRLLLPLITALVLPAQAGVDPEVHELCLKASDYKGCVEMQKQSDNKKVKSKKTNGVLSIFQLKKEPSKRQLRERCLLGNEAGYEAGYVGVIESIDKCVDVLSQVGSTVLDIDPLLHKTCGAGMGELGEYLLCITNNSNWEVPEDVANEHRLAKQKSEQATDDFWKQVENPQGCPKGTKYYEYSYGKTFFGAKVGKWKTSGYCLTDGEAAQMEMGVNNANSRRKQRMLDRTLDRLNRPTITCTTYGATTTCR